MEDLAIYNIAVNFRKRELFSMVATKCNSYLPSSLTAIKDNYKRSVIAISLFKMMRYQTNISNFNDYNSRKFWSLHQDTLMPSSTFWITSIKSYNRDLICNLFTLCFIISLEVFFFSIRRRVKNYQWEKPGIVIKHYIILFLIHFRSVWTRKRKSHFVLR